jgi:hypothetical protein
MERARRKRWQFVALDLALDTTTPAGELVANVMASVAQWERRVISQRTRDALAAKKATGARLGRPRDLAEAESGRGSSQSVTQALRGDKSQTDSTRIECRPLVAVRLGVGGLSGAVARLVLLLCSRGSTRG